MGYKNRIIRIDFPELAEDTGDPIFILLRNPKLMPATELRSYAEKISPESAAAAGGDDPAAAVAAAAGDRDMDAAYRMFARMIVAWRVYDATAVPQVDAAGNITGDQPLLPLPATADLIAKLPLEIIERLGAELGKASPKTSQEPGTTTPS